MQKLTQSALSKHVVQLMLAMFLVGGAAVATTGCEQDGAAENIGESMDEGVEEAQDEVDDNT